MTPTSRIELSLQGKGLKDHDTFSKSDPFAIVSLFQGTSWIQIGQTEVITNSLNPSWTTLIALDYYFEQHQRIKVEIWDYDTNHKHDLIGGCEFLVGSVVGAPGQSGTFLLTRGKETSKHEGSLRVRVTEVQVSNQMVHFQWDGSSLANMDGLFSKSDPFFILSRQHPDQSWIPVYKSEVIRNNVNPEWKPVELSVQTLCQGMMERPILVQVMDEDRGGKSELIGQVLITLKECMEKKNCSFILHNETLAKKKGKKYTNAGLLLLQHMDFYTQSSFLDYLQGGLEMNLIIGLDYTGSNGPVHDPYSLHYVHPTQWNAYQYAIYGTGSILEAYDMDHKIPVYGFGGIPPQETQVNHCFPLNLNSFNPEIDSISGVLELYQSSLSHIQLHGPTLFAPLIHQTMAIAQTMRSSSLSQKYFILMIVTDGAIMDMPQTIDAIVQASHTHPLSIVIIGVGPADFSSMQALDGDKQPLHASNGQVAARDIVQFVPFSRVSHDPMLLAHETLAEIPHQVISYMKKHQIPPQPALPPTFQVIEGKKDTIPPPFTH